MTIIYLGLFWFFALFYILVKTMKSKEITLNSGILNKFTRYSTIIKIFPAGLAILFTLYNGHESIYLSLVLSLGLFLCMLGDLGMERGLIPGLPIFLVAQVVLLIAFIGHSFEIGVTTDSLLLSGVVAVGTVVYIILFLRYLD